MLSNKNSLIPRETSIPTTLIWFVYAATYFSMSFHLAAIANAVGGTLWGVVALYRARLTEQVFRSENAGAQDMTLDFPANPRWQ